LQSPAWAQPLPTHIAMGAGCVQFEKFFSALRRVNSSPFLHTVDVHNIGGWFVGSQQAYEQRRDSACLPEQFTDAPYRDVTPTA
jgi:hypothetical protein